jgi:ribosomal-protein-serine acetyltransferase
LKSEAIPQRLGFTFEGIERAGELHGNAYLNLKIYSLLKKDG